MGQSTPTTTMALDTFESRYASFRSELPRQEQVWFDELVCRARRHSNAINRRPHLDFERPVFLAMLMETLQEVGDLQEQVTYLQAELHATRQVLQDAGLVPRRVQPPSPERLGHLGQTRFDELRDRPVRTVERASRAST